MDGDAPFSVALQERVRRIHGFRACYATNLHAPRPAHRAQFFAIPVGLPYHQARRAGLCGLQSRQYQDLGLGGHAFYTRAGYVGAAVTTVPGS